MKSFKIYLLKFKDGSVYIGRTSRKGDARFKQHKWVSDATTDIYHRPLYVKWRELGDPTEEILENFLTLEQAKYKEHDYTLAYILMGYEVLNIDLGDKPSEEHRHKISIAKRGENHHYFGKHLSESHKHKLSEALKGENNPFYGKQHSEESKIKMSQAKKGMFSGSKNPSAKPKEWWATNPIPRYRFKKICNRMGWLFEEFSEEFVGYLEKPNGKREKIYTYTKMLDKI